MPHGCGHTQSHRPAAAATIARPPLVRPTPAQLSKDAEFRKRIELVQDLEFPTAASKLKISKDVQFMVATGTYPPAVRVLHTRYIYFHR